MTMPTMAPVPRPPPPPDCCPLFGSTVLVALREVVRVIVRTVPPEVVSSGSVDVSLVTVEVVDLTAAVEVDEVVVVEVVVAVEEEDEDVVVGLELVLVDEEEVVVVVIEVVTTTVVSLVVEGMVVVGVTVVAVLVLEVVGAAVVGEVVVGVAAVVGVVAVVTMTEVGVVTVTAVVTETPTDSSCLLRKPATPPTLWPATKFAEDTASKASPKILRLQPGLLNIPGPPMVYSVFSTEH